MTMPQAWLTNQRLTDYLRNLRRSGELGGQLDQFLSFMVRSNAKSKDVYWLKELMDSRGY